MGIGYVIFFLFLLKDLKNRIAMSHKHEGPPRKFPIVNEGAKRKRSQKKYTLPVIGHFADRSVEFKNIIEAERVTGINYTLIFEACIGKIYKAKDVHWEFKKGNHYIKYKAYYINAQKTYTRKTGFNG
jgi:hypothetical protein